MYARVEGIGSVGNGNTGADNPGLKSGAERDKALPGLRPGTRFVPVVMTVLGGSFLLRVIGQVLVTYAGVDWLPAKAHWQSGLLPYPVLLGSQVVILAVMVGIARDAWQGRGRFVLPRPRFGRFLRIAGLVYFAAMIVRYVVTMALHPDWFPFEHSIPTFFHCILATYLFLYSRLASGGDGVSSVASPGVPNGAGGRT